MDPAEVLKFFSAQAAAASKERQAQTEAFTTALSGLRRDLWLSMLVSSLLFAIILLARDGVFTKIGIPGLGTFETTRSAMPGPERPELPSLTQERAL